MPQTSYALRAAALYAGQLADSADLDARSYRNDDTVELPLGVAVVQNAAKDDGCKLPNGAGGKYVGVTFNDVSRNPTGLTTGSYEVGSMVPTGRRMRVAVTVEETVTPNSPVFVRHTAGAGGTQKGAFRTSADTATAEQVNGWCYVVGATAGNVAILEVDVPASR